MIYSKAFFALKKWTHSSQLTFFMDFFEWWFKKDYITDCYSWIWNMHYFIAFDLKVSYMEYIFFFFIPLFFFFLFVFLIRKKKQKKTNQNTNVFRLSFFMLFMFLSFMLNTRKKKFLKIFVFSSQILCHILVWIKVIKSVLVDYVEIPDELQRFNDFFRCRFYLLYMYNTKLNHYIVYN